MLDDIASLIISPIQIADAAAPLGAAYRYYVDDPNNGKGSDVRTWPKAPAPPAA